MIAGYFKYMGLNMQLTDEELKKLQSDLSKNDTHMDEWLSNKLGVDRGNSLFQRKKEMWWFPDRFILYPELYKTHISKYLKEELPTYVATYVRGMFTGSSERITQEKIDNALNNLKSENPNWWHDPEWKKVFLERFSLIYPKCVDGKRRESKAEHSKVAQTKPPSQAKSNTKGKEEKVITINIFTLIFCLVALFVLYNLLKWIF